MVGKFLIKLCIFTIGWMKYTPSPPLWEGIQIYHAYLRTYACEFLSDIIEIDFLIGQVVSEKFNIFYLEG